MTRTKRSLCSGMASGSERGCIHSAVWASDAWLDLPIVVEVVETEARIKAVLPELDNMIGGGLITLERAHVILYRPAGAADDARDRQRLEGLEPKEE